MPDISLCRNTNCPLRNNCYRFTAKPDEFRQAYGSFTYDYETKSCDHYWARYEEAKAQQLADMFSAKLIDNSKNTEKLQ